MEKNGKILSAASEILKNSALWLALGLSAAVAHAAQKDSLWKIGNRHVPFVRDTERHLTIDKNCLKPTGQFSCEAYSSLSRAATVSLKGRVNHGGRNPGAVVCAQELHGKVVIGTDERGNQQSFCSFADGSYVSCGSIVFAAHSNSSN